MSAKRKSRTSGRKATKSRSASRTRGAQGFPREGGPRSWFRPILESAYARLTPRGQGDASPGIAPPPRPQSVRRGAGGAVRPVRTVEALAPVGSDYWLDRLAEYKRRKAGAVAAVPRRAAMAPGAPAIPGQKNWSTLGPFVVLNGQAEGLPAMGGRVPGIAVAPGGLIVYAASANGGVFRSDDGGVTWRALMDAFDVDPTNFASTSLACGAIAIDLHDPDRVYVGTGEGDTHSMFDRRIVGALPAYRGIGPIRSDDGGENWVREETAAGSPELVGKAFFALAVDPSNREHVIAATTEGLYERVTKGAGHEWARRRPGVHSSVVVASTAAGVRFLAAEWGEGVFQSTNGADWARLDAGFPAANVGRVALAVQPDRTDLVYAMVANAKGALLGLFRYEDAKGSWIKVANAPNVLPANEGRGQGDYDLALALDPKDPDLVYMGGSYNESNSTYWPASIWRCRVRSTASGFRMTGEAIGDRVHADVHCLLHTPGDPDDLWTGCDGGVFRNRNPRASDNFGNRNNGLACLCTNYFDQHPTDPNILFSGLQDNGTARTRSSSTWRHVNGGDGGYCLIHWADPQQVLVFANGTVSRATDGGQDHDSWKHQSFPWSMMTEPIVGTPYNPSRPADASLVALGEGTTIHLSRNFGVTWPAGSVIEIPASAGIFALVFASPTRLFAGTARGEVFRIDASGSAWNVTRIDDAAAGPLGLVGLIADIAIDWSDDTRSSVYIAFGGAGDYRHVWHFDGTRWQARSGPAGKGKPNLLDVEHNAIVVDEKDPTRLYVGADIGVWLSEDSGGSWEPLSNGLPDAPVFDLQIHPTRRLLRASTHGRGLYEFPLDGAP